MAKDRFVPAESLALCQGSFHGVITEEGQAFAVRIYDPPKIVKPCPDCGKPMEVVSRHPRLVTCCREHGEWFAREIGGLPAVG